jgi:ribosome-binding factor A
MSHDRPARVAEEFRHELTRLLARGLKDPRVTGFVTVTGAKMSPDLREVTVFVSVHPSSPPPPGETATLGTGPSSPPPPGGTATLGTGGSEVERDRTMEGLSAAAGYLQREVSRSLRLRHTPHLRFEYDESVERGDRMERLIKEAREKDAQGGS